MYLLKQDKERMKQLLMRGADVNFVNPMNGWTALHTAIEYNLSSKIIKFLIKQGADVHAKDFSGRDCCERASQKKRYSHIQELVDPIQAMKNEKPQRTQE